MTSPESQNKTQGHKMNKYTTAQLKAALVELHKMDELAAYQLAFNELNRRMGDDAFDAWCDEVGI